MRFWSKGLGERELVIDLSKGNLTMEEGKVFMRGIIAEPVAWHYEVTLFGDDIRGMLRVILSPQALIYFLKNIAGVGTFIIRVFKRDIGLNPQEMTPDEKRPGEKAQASTDSQ